MIVATTRCAGRAARSCRRPESDRRPRSTPASIVMQRTTSVLLSTAICSPVPIDQPALAPDQPALFCRRGERASRPPHRSLLTRAETAPSSTRRLASRAAPCTDMSCGSARQLAIDHRCHALRCQTLRGRWNDDEREDRGTEVVRALDRSLRRSDRSICVRARGRLRHSRPPRSRRCDSISLRPASEVETASSTRSASVELLARISARATLAAPMHPTQTACATPRCIFA